MSRDPRSHPPERLAVDWLAGAVALGVVPTLAARVVLLAVARAMGGDHTTYITERALVVVTGLGGATVRRGLAWLARHGAVVDRGPGPHRRADRVPRVRAYGDPVYHAAGAAPRATSWEARGLTGEPPRDGHGGSPASATGARQRARRGLASERRSGSWDRAHQTGRPGGDLHDRIERRRLLVEQHPRLEGETHADYRRRIDALLAHPEAS